MSVHHAAETGSGAVRPEPATAVHHCLIEHRRDYLRYFRGRLSRPEEAEDAFQDFCVKAIRGAGAPDDLPGARAWLRCVLRSTIVDHYRRRAAQRRGEDAYRLEPRQMQVEPGIDDTPACRCVAAALAGLRTDQADLIRRLDLDEEPRTAVAEDHGVTANALGVRLHRARQALRDAIADVCTTCGDGRFADCDC
ncbi:MULTISPECIES: RNA polymerase sigma factor [unclassified Roseitalea]|uniref:RNA polymerase sigma factor n=1 Tax=unclassified Roseitalea TaxID=2639107 RepID=UPI00273D04F7|nr:MULTISPECIES: RNA polymerase sigma factor [unclassified Roseitalea]